MNSADNVTDIDHRPIYEKYPDIMVDLETTGLNQGQNAIIQLAAVRFNLAEGTFCLEAFFDRALSMPDNRFWMESTRNWWLKDKREILMGIMARSEPPKEVLTDFIAWVGPNAVMWGKPTHFDHSFLGSYCQDFELPHPFHFRMANDMNSFIRSRYFPEKPPQWEWDLPFVGDKHNALHDCIHQIKTLMAVVKHTSVTALPYTLDPHVEDLPVEEKKTDADDAPF